jgi:hypothetical protein
MAEFKMSCPKCGGHILFPKEISGTAADCPHCHEGIVLGTKPRNFFLMTIYIGIICLVFCSIVVIWQLLKPAHVKQSSAEITKVFERNEITRKEKMELSKEDKVIEALCRSMYEYSNANDFNSMYQLLASPCKQAMTAAELGNEFTSEGGKYKFIALESITYNDTSSIKTAIARVRRVFQDSYGESEASREIKCIKEQGGWKLFRDAEWTNKILAEYERYGFNEIVRTNIQRYCLSNPFNKWPENETNAFERIYENRHPGAKEIFPWYLSFTMTTNYIKDYKLVLGYSLRNNASNDWNTPSLRFQLKQGGKITLKSFEIIPTLSTGTEVTGESSFFLENPLQENTRYELDAIYTLSGGNKCFLVVNLPIEFKVQKLTESVKLELLAKSFDKTKSYDGEDLFVARVDYRVCNVGNEPLKRLSFKFVWLSLKGEVWDQTTEYAVSYSDLPLNPHQTKSGFVHCGKGYKNQIVPVKVDIYLEEGERYSLLYKGIVVP